MQKFVRPLFRIFRNFIYRCIEKITPYVTYRKYLGFNLFFVKGPGTIDRIRFLSPRPIYEEPLCKSITEDLQKYDLPVFIDIGANLGLISLYIHRYVPKVHIFAFEPGIQQRSLFGLTIANNSLSESIQLFPYAITDKQDMVTFVSYENAVDGSGDGLVNTGRVIGKPCPISVEATTLDTFITKQKIKSIHVIKIDIEGGELQAFAGSESTIATFRPTVYFEMNPLNFKNYHYTQEEIFSFFNKHNYSVTDLSGIACTSENFLQLIEKQGDMFVARPRI